MQHSLPSQAKKYFWGDDLKELSWTEHERYITQTLLDKGDMPSVSWLLKQSSPQHILELLPTLKVPPKTKRFWEIYLS